MGAKPDGPELRWLDDRRLRVGGHDFYCDHELNEAPADHLAVMKPRSVVEAYADLGRYGSPSVIVELGIHRGGSTALLWELFRPSRLLAFDLSTVPVAALADHLARTGGDDAVRPHYGVDQSDREQLAALVEADLDGRAIDLVIDDASHRYDPTVASFEVLFPLVRPGGRFIIEDWRWEDQLRAEMRKIWRTGGEAAAALSDKVAAVVAERGGDAGPPQARPLSRLALELVLARADGDAIAGVTINAPWVVVERGSAELDPTSFRVSDLCFDSFRQLVPLAES